MKSMKHLRHIFSGILFLTASVPVHAALSDYVPFQTPDQVWDDLNADLLDSSEAMDILALFDRPIKLAPDANLDRLLAVPGIMPTDIASLRFLLETGRNPSEHEKYGLFESFVEQGALRGRMQISLSPSLSRQTDFRKKGRGQFNAGPVHVECEISDDTAGTFCNSRSIQVTTSAFTIEAGEFSHQVGKGILLGHASPRPLHTRLSPEDLAESVAEPLSAEPDGIIGSFHLDQLQVGGYAARLLGRLSNPRVAGSWLQWNFTQRVHIGAETQVTKLGPAVGVYFAAGRAGASGEIVTTMQSGPAWLLSFAMPDHGSDLTLYRYPENSFFLLGNPFHRQAGSAVVVESETLRTSVPPEQGVQVDQSNVRAALRFRAWQHPGKPQTGLQLSGSSWLTLGQALRTNGSFALEQSLEDEITAGPQMSMVWELRRIDFEGGARARATDVLTVSTTSWLGAIYRLGPFHRLRARIYSSRSNTGTSSERLWVSYETGASSRARVASSWNIPFDDPGKGWASVRVEMSY